MASKEWISVAQFHTRGFRPSRGQEFVPVEREENRGSMFFFGNIVHERPSESRFGLAPLASGRGRLVRN